MRKYGFVFLVIIILLCACSCSQGEKMESISDLAFDRSGNANLVYILEDDKYIPFLVLTDDYNGNTLLLRKEILDENRRISDYSAYYANSTVDLYLNGEYLESLTEISQYLTSSNVEITCEDSLGVSGLDTELIDKCVFLLSCNEVGIDNSVNIAPEGETLEFFRNEENRKAYVNEKLSSWWLRTPNTYYLSCTYVIGDNNKIGYTNAYDANGIRPAFCVRNDSPIVLKTGIVDNQSVYVFSYEN